jgi:hypothetical protein
MIWITVSGSGSLHRRGGCCDAGTVAIPHFSNVFLSSKAARSEVFVLIGRASTNTPEKFSCRSPVVKCLHFAHSNTDINCCLKSASSGSSWCDISTNCWPLNGFSSAHNSVCCVGLKERHGMSARSFAPSISNCPARRRASPASFSALAASSPACASELLSIFCRVASNSLTLSSKRNSPTTPAATINQPIREIVATQGNGGLRGFATRNPKASSRERLGLRCDQYSDSSFRRSWNISGASSTTPKPTRNVAVESQKWYPALPSERNGRTDSSSVRITDEDTYIWGYIRQSRQVKTIILLVGIPLLGFGIWRALVQ